MSMTLKFSSNYDKFVIQNVYLFNSEAPERSRGLHARCARSGTKVKEGSDHSENMNTVFWGAKNSNFSKKFPDF